jgi:hypothetical protein
MASIGIGMALAGWGRVDRVEKCMERLAEQVQEERQKAQEERRKAQEDNKELRQIIESVLKRLDAREEREK